jgi:hypothetical protein
VTSTAKVCDRDFFLGLVFSFSPFFGSTDASAHSNFLGYVKNIGPVVISIMDYTPPDDPVKKEPEVKPRERSKSAVFAKKLKPSTEKSVRTQVRHNERFCCVILLCYVILFCFVYLFVSISLSEC